VKIITLVRSEIQLQRSKAHSSDAPAGSVGTDSMGREGRGTDACSS